MLENRNLKLDLLALAMLATVIFLAAALFTYDPADPPGTLVFPQHRQPANVCGYCGAHRQPMVVRGPWRRRLLLCWFRWPSSMRPC